MVQWRWKGLAQALVEPHMQMLKPIFICDWSALALRNAGARGRRTLVRPTNQMVALIAASTRGSNARLTFTAMTIAPPIPRTAQRRTRAGVSEIKRISPR
jgi:hypothetical protein